MLAEYRATWASLAEHPRGARHDAARAPTPSAPRCATCATTSRRSPPSIRSPGRTRRSPRRRRCCRTRRRCAAERRPRARSSRETCRSPVTATLDAARKALAESARHDPTLEERVDRHRVRAVRGRGRRERARPLPRLPRGGSRPPRRRAAHAAATSPRSAAAWGGTSRESWSTRPRPRTGSRRTIHGTNGSTRGAPRSRGSRRRSRASGAALHDARADAATRLAAAVNGELAQLAMAAGVLRRRRRATRSRAPSAPTPSR